MEETWRRRMLLQEEPSLLQDVHTGETSWRRKGTATESPISSAGTLFHVDRHDLPAETCWAVILARSITPLSLRGLRSLRMRFLSFHRTQTNVLKSTRAQSGCLPGELEQDVQQAALSMPAKGASCDRCDLYRCRAELLSLLVHVSALPLIPLIFNRTFERLQDRLEEPVGPSRYL